MIRVGQGFDVHALVPDRLFVVGGVTIDYHLGLAGHSDADVLVHAIIDALLGAAGLADIGQLFPDTDLKHKNADSRELLKQAYQLVQSHDYRLGNIDATIICESPKLANYIPEMINNIALDCQCKTNQVNIKATTTERLGFVGRSEGVAAQAICLLDSI